MDLGEGMLRSRAGRGVVSGAVAGPRHPGLLALGSASGLGLPHGCGRPAPTAFNRAGEKLRTAGGQLPRVCREADPQRCCGLAVPLLGEEGLGAPGRVRKGAGQAASGWLAGGCWQAVLAATAGSQLAPWTIME